MHMRFLNWDDVNEIKETERKRYNISGKKEVYVLTLGKNECLFTDIFHSVDQLSSKESKQK